MHCKDHAAGLDPRFERWLNIVLITFTYVG